MCKVMYHIGVMQRFLMPDVSPSHKREFVMILTLLSFPIFFFLSHFYQRRYQGLLLLCREKPQEQGCISMFN